MYPAVPFFSNGDKAEVIILKQLRIDLETSIVEIDTIKTFYLERAKANAAKEHFGMGEFHTIVLHIQHLFP